MPGSSFARILTTGGSVSDSLPLSVKEYGPPSFRVYADAVAPANNKYMAVLFSTSTAYDVFVQRISVFHNNPTTATGVILEADIRRISAYTAAAAITPIAFDPADSLPSGITADTGSSAVSDVASSTLLRFITTGEEAALASTDTLLSSRYTSRGAIVYEAGAGLKPIVLHGDTAAQRGIAVKCLTSSTAGALSLAIDFTVIAV